MIEKEILKYALVINLIGNSKKEAINAWKVLKEVHSIKYISSRSPCPHITLQSDFEIINIDLFKIHFSKFCQSQKIFKLTSIGLGVFIRETPVIHIRWSKNKELNLLQKKLRKFLVSIEKQKLISNYFDDLDWIPKTTLAYKDTNYNNLNELILLVNENNFIRTMNVLSISLYEYSNDLGENKLETFKLGEI
jgi:2'-5' RNA ligase